MDDFAELALKHAHTATKWALVALVFAAISLAFSMATIGQCT
jgi:hypothetical protein